MTTQFIKNDKGEKTGVVIPVAEYEELLHKSHISLELTDEYKNMIATMFEEDDNGTAEYVSYKNIRDRFLPQ